MYIQSEQSDPCYEGASRASGMHLDNGRILFSEIIFDLESWGASLHKEGALSFVVRKALDGELYQLRDYPLPKSLPPRSVRLQIQDVVGDLLHLCKLFREGSMERHTSFHRPNHIASFFLSKSARRANPRRTSQIPSGLIATAVDDGNENPNQASRET